MSNKTRDKKSLISRVLLLIICPFFNSRGRCVLSGWDVFIYPFMEVTTISIFGIHLCQRSEKLNITVWKTEVWMPLVNIFYHLPMFEVNKEQEASEKKQWWFSSNSFHLFHRESEWGSVCVCVCQTWWVLWSSQWGHGVGQVEVGSDAELALAGGGVGGGGRPQLLLPSLLVSCWQVAVNQCLQKLDNELGIIWYLGLLQG